MGLNIKTIFSLRKDLEDDSVFEEIIDDSHNERKQNENNLIKLISTKIHKITNEQINKLIEFLTNLN